MKLGPTLMDAVETNTGAVRRRSIALRRGPAAVHALAAAAAAASPRRRVVFHCCGDATAARRSHDIVSKASVARAMAELLGYDFAADGDGATGSSAAAAPYLVPTETLVGAAAAATLGVRGPQDLFGGVVPFEFVASKVISHPLVTADALAPTGWSTTFGEQVRDVVLPGFSVFTPEDALMAGRRLLQGGVVRLKDAEGVGGSGQTVVRTVAELEAQVALLDHEALRSKGLVLERNLEQLTTYSVGQVLVGDLLASYCGTQQLTRNHQDEAVYGGSDLRVARGNWDALLALEIHADAKTAVRHALAYHRAAMDCFEGMFVSRANYDVVQGVDAAGTAYTGVLEQSWRIGGASGAEVAALQALKDQPARQQVQASTQEVYRADPVLPTGAVVHYSGLDGNHGPLTKFAWVHDDVDD